VESAAQVPEHMHGMRTS